MLGSQSQIIFRISYFATVEKWAGRGFAKLLLTHLKEQAGQTFREPARTRAESVELNSSIAHSLSLLTDSASMARSTGKEVTMVLLSLAHTLKFWTSKSMVR